MSFGIEPEDAPACLSMAANPGGAVPGGAGRRPAPADDAGVVLT